MYVILPTRPKDRDDISLILDNVFGVNRKNKPSYALRNNFPAIDDLSFVARCGERVVGTISFWHISIGNKKKPALLLGPLGVAPEMQNYGIGGSLISKGHVMAKEKGYKLILLVGELSYYSRFNYISASPFGLTMKDEDPARLLVHELEFEALNGISGQLQPAEHFRPNMIKKVIMQQASY